ncbi:MAG: hypothetical protein KatS3mg111_1271 [Pirellulaceae bacterium]|nr:MAG: hypothetical protein KatS3mg111_1271 [Pirellulaceae bacterium]
MSERNHQERRPILTQDSSGQPTSDQGARAPCSVCPVCGGALIEIRAKLQCSRCHTICETCCEGGRG